MGATYTRQSTYTDGDTITAAHTNDEFDQLLAAFATSTGHTHDGTTAEGGPITKLLGNTLTFGAGTAGTDITITYDGETNDGVMKWMEDEDYFEFSDDILIASTEKLQFRDTAIYINSSTDGQLDLVADTEIQIASTTIDMNGAVDISGNLGVGGNLTVTGTTTFNGGTLTLGDANTDNIVFGGEIDSDIIPDDDDTHDLGSASKQWKDIYIDGVAYLDSIDLNGTTITSTAAELNILDGVTSTAAELNALDGITAVVGELNALDIGSTAIGTAVASKAVILDANKDYTGIRNLTLAGDLTISGDDLTMATNTAGALLIADGTNFNPTAVGDLSEISTVANDDVFLAVDTSGGGLKKITRSAVVAGLATSSAISNLSEDSTPQLGGNLDLNGNDIVTTSNATLDLAPNGTGTVVIRGNTNSGAIVFNCESNSHGQTVIAQPHSASVTNTMLLPAGANSTLVSLVSTDTLTNKTLTSPKINEDVAVTSTATELNLLDGVTATTAELNILDGVTSTAAELNILDGVTSTAAELNALDGITAVVGELNALDLGATAVGTAIASKAVILDSNKDYTGIRNFTVSGELDAATGDFSGDVDVDGTLEADAITIGGTAVASIFSPIAGGTGILTTGALDAGSITSGFGTIDNGASTITTTGVITGGTLEATTDTAAGDNAAIGYTAGEGLILTGQGSTSDVTIKNDADATVASIATGTTVFTMADDVFVTGRAAGTMTTDNDGSLDLAVSNNFKVTTGGDLTLTLTNPAIGQSGNILFINASNHTISAHASILINADVLTAISASGSYHLTYYATATSGNNTILVSASAILT